MSILNPGTLCVVVAGCPENIGLIVEVVRRMGACHGQKDAYVIKTVSGRPFHQLWCGNDLLRSCSPCAITDRHKLRPLSAGGPDAGVDALDAGHWPRGTTPTDSPDAARGRMPG